MLESFNLPLEEWIETNCKTGLISNCLGIPWKILLKTELLGHKLLKESVAIVPVLESEISSKNAEIEL